MNKKIQLMAAFVISFIIAMPISLGFSIGTPTATVIDDRSVQIDWTTTELATSKVNYGTTSVSETKTEDTLTDNHSVLLTGLIANQDYVYDIASENASGHEEVNDNGGNHFNFKTYETVTISGLKIAAVSETDDYVFYEVNWTTNIGADGKVLFGNSSDNLDDSVSGASGRIDHTVEIKLEKAKTYYYQVQSSYKKSVVRSLVVPVDITPPEITIDSFDSATQEIINAGAIKNDSFVLKGVIEPNVTVTIFHNFINVGSFKVDDTGEMEKTLSVSNGINRYFMEVADEHNNKASFEFNLTADVLEPIIRLLNFEDSTINETMLLKVSFNEEVMAEVYVNTVSVFESSDYLLNFTKEIDLAEEENNITIIAVDRAGNEAVLTKYVGRLGPPNVTISWPIPDEVTGYVATTLKEVIIKGYTTPGSVVTVYERIDDPQFEEPTDFVANVTADETGKFEVELELVSTDFDFSAVFQEADSSRYVGGTKDEVVAYMNTHNETKIKVSLEAEDPYGRKSPQRTELTFFSTPCDVPGKFVVSILPDEHYFKPYRLRDGTELVNIDVQLTWRGFSPDYRVRSVRIVPQQKFQKYYNETDYECFIDGEVAKNWQLVSSVSNENQTFWRFTYMLNPWKGMNESKVGSLQEAWKSLVNNDCKIPIEVHVDYQTTSLLPTVDPTTGQTSPAGGWLDPEKMVKCGETSNLIQEEVDHTKVLPQELLDAGIGILNLTNQFLQEIAPWVSGLHKIAGGTCLLYIGRYFTKHATTMGTCTVNMGEAQLKKSEGASDEELKSIVEPCANAIQEEKDTYNHYRLACDRVLCKSTPVNPERHPQATKPSAGSSDPAKLQNIDTKLIGDKGQPNKCLPTTKYSCYKGKRDSVDDQLAAGCIESKPIGSGGTTVEESKKAATTKALFFTTSDCRPEDGKFCCLRASYNKGKITEIIYQKEDAWPVKPDQSNKGEFFVNEPWNYGTFAGYRAETPETLVENLNGWFSKKDSEAKAVRDGIKGNNVNAPGKVAYVEGLHGPSCFNSGSVFLGSKRAFLEPTQNFRSAIQCGCLSQINGYVRQWERLTGEMLRCLQEAKAGDTFTAAACEELFTQFVCDLFTYVMVEFVMGKIDESFNKNSVDEGEHGFGEGFASGLKGAGTIFTEDYKESFHGQFDLGVSSLSHAVCMGALTGEWDPNLQSALGFGDQTPPRQSTAFISTARAELLSANPITGAATYEYTMGLWLQPGSNLLNYRVELVCDYEGDCPAVTETLPFVTTDGSFPGVKTDIKQTDPTETPAGHMRVSEKFIRYNKMRVCWTSAAGAEFSAEPPHCEEKEITGWTTALFGCALEPSKAVSGNKIWSCPKYISDQYAEFAQEPPAEMSFSFTDQDSTGIQRFKIPFKIRAEYGQTTMQERPFLIQYKQIEGEGVGTIEGVEVIREGYTEEHDYGFDFTVKEGDFTGQGLQKVTAEMTIGDTNDVCRISSESGVVAKQGAIIIDWTQGGNLIDKMFYHTGTDFEFKDPGAMDESIGGGIPAGTNTISVSFKLNGVDIVLSLTKGVKCEVEVIPPRVSGDTAKITKKFSIGLHKSRQGDPLTPDALIVRQGNKQQYKEISVTLTNNKGSASSSSADSSTDLKGSDKGISFTINKVSNEGAYTTVTPSTVINPGDKLEIEVNLDPIKNYKIQSVEARIEEPPVTGSDRPFVRHFLAKQEVGTSLTMTYILPNDIRENDQLAIQVTTTEPETTRDVRQLNVDRNPISESSEEGQ